LSPRAESDRATLHQFFSVIVSLSTPNKAHLAPSPASTHSTSSYYRSLPIITYDAAIAASTIPSITFVVTPFSLAGTGMRHAAWKKLGSKAGASIRSAQ
jgi:hypothetical protein